jgi:hypothetical protein
MSNVTVTWTGGTLAPNNRSYGLRLQYRGGAEGSFQDVLGTDGEPVEYVRSEVVGDWREVGPVVLPPAVNDRSLVHLRWRYYFIPTGASGARAALRLDDIVVSADGERVPLRLERWRYLGDLRLEGRFRGLPGETVKLLRSVDLTSWTAVRLLRATVDGAIQFEDYALPGSTARFYRLERVP